ncbi:hypothetical protein NG799_25715 [Laspinema sp. D1]|uniref:Uncharacterized protein n=1 Tax=Laspinema palackyanum D2a TaxID=2953684 RepID=A0ABT2MY75_9CYAN|nr:hypothetical protein [Laspinema sp. D2a]
MVQAKRRQLAHLKAEDFVFRYLFLTTGQRGEALTVYLEATLGIFLGFWEDVRVANGSDATRLF